MLRSHVPFRPLRLALVLALSVGVYVRAAVPEYAAKALLVSHLISFVSWPNAAPAGEFKVGILGSTPFHGALQEALAGDTVKGRPIVLVRAATAAALRDCALVVVTADARESLPYILATLGDRPVLTVSDVRDFADRGGMVGFVINDQHKIRVQINLDAVRASGLKMSSQLLRVADIVKGAPQ